MPIVTSLAALPSEAFDTHRCSTDAGTETALLCLRADDAEFIDAALAVLAPQALVQGRGACRIDELLWESSLACLGSACSRAEVYRAAISAVQAHCRRCHGARFQQLPEAVRREVLATVENGRAFAGISAFQFLPAMLRADAAAPRPRASPAAARA